MAHGKNDIKARPLFTQHILRNRLLAKLLSVSFVITMCIFGSSISYYPFSACGCNAAGTANVPNFDFLECIRDEVSARSYPGKVHVFIIIIWTTFVFRLYHSISQYSRTNFVPIKKN